MSNFSKISNKVLNVSSLNVVLEELKSQNKKIVFTNGCFDILHKGHVEYLAKAADAGDVLILGLNSDNSVRRQGKGEERPINLIDARETVLAALFFVDYIIEFDDETPIELIKSIKPAVLIKGGDYDPNETNKSSKKYIVGKDVVEENGGVVKVINLVPGFSTTLIINKINIK